MRNRKTSQHSEEQEGLLKSAAQTSQTLYEAYASSVGKIFQGVLEGGLGATIAGMSSVADDEMLGIHAALGATWLALTAKHFAEAGNEYLNKKEEDIENFGVEILTYARLKSSRSGEYFPKPEDFVKDVNKDLIQAVNGALAEAKSAQLSEDEKVKINSVISEFSKEKFEEILQERTALMNSKVLVAGAVIGAAGVVGGVTTMAVAKAAASASALNAGIAVAGTGAALTSISGGFLSASAANSRSISSNLLQRVKALNELTFGAECSVNDVRDEVRQSIRPAASPKAISGASAAGRSQSSQLGMV